MKKFIFMSIALVAMVFCFASCSKPETPATIAEGCIENIKNGDYDAFVETLDADEETKSQFKQLFEAKGKEMIEKSGGIASYKIVSEEISEDGKTAKVKAEIEYGNGKKKDEKFNFVNVDGKWKQVIKK